MEKAWNGFTGGKWQEAINVRDFIQANVHPYTGDASFVAGPTEKSTRLWQRCLELLAQERKKDGVLDVDTHTVSKIDAFGPGYIEKDNEVIVGLQTDAPLKRSLIVNGGIRMAEQAAEAYGYKVDEKISDIYHNHAVTHNEAVFHAYTDEMREVRSLGILTGLPDAYGRGRIIGDYRRVALYGVQRLIAEKERDLQERSGLMSEATIRLREEINKVDDWANGIYAALRDVLMHQLRESPELGKTLAKNWSRAARDFDRIHVQGLPAKQHEPLEFLEARKMFYRVFTHLGAMPKVGRG